LELNNLIDILINDKIGNIHTAIPGVIEEYDGINMTAKVSPLDQEYPLLIEVPIMFYKTGVFAVRPNYKKGDIVQILFNEEAIDLLINDNNRNEPGFTRQFSLDDGVIIGGILPENESLSQKGLNDYIIENLDTGNKIIIYETGGIELQFDESNFIRIEDSQIILKTDTKVILENDTIKLGSDSATEQLPFLSELNNFIDNFNDLVGAFNSHTHTYSWTDPGGSGSTGTPSNSGSTESTKSGTQKVVAE